MYVLLFAHINSREIRSMFSHNLCKQRPLSKNTTFKVHDLEVSFLLPTFCSITFLCWLCPIQKALQYPHWNCINLVYFRQLFITKIWVVSYKFSTILKWQVINTNLETWIYLLKSPYLTLEFLEYRDLLYIKMEIISGSQRTFQIWATVSCL